MNLFSRLVDASQTWFRWAANAALVLMMLLISAAVGARALGLVFTSQLELVEFAMGSVVMLGLAYTEKVHSHVTVGLVVDRLPIRWQLVADLFAAVLIFAVCVVIGWANLKAAIGYATVDYRSSDYLSIPLWPFKLIVSLGFWLWGLQAIFHIPEIIRGSRQRLDSEASGEYA